MWLGTVFPDQKIKIVYHELDYMKNYFQIDTDILSYIFEIQIGGMKIGACGRIAVYVISDRFLKTINFEDSVVLLHILNTARKSKKLR